MLRRLAKIITNNFGLKIMAVVFAAVLWLVVVNIEDPDKTVKYTIPVTIENAEYLTKMDKTYDVLNDSDKITFTVSGKRSVIKELSESDFTATANMDNINEDMTQIPITVTASRYKNQIEITKRTSYMNIKVENLVTKKIAINVETEGSPGSGCSIGRTLVTPEKVTISGPESIVDQIATAQVTVDVTDAEESIATNGDIELLDENGKTISQERLTLNRTRAAVDVVILMGKSVPVKVETSGTPPDGYECSEVTSSVSKVQLTGSAEVLDRIEEIKVTSGRLNISDATSSFNVTLNLLSYLPDGAILADGEPTSIDVSVKISGKETKSYSALTSNITVKNLADDLELEFVNDTFSVKLAGFRDELNNITASSLKATLDASDLTEGTHTVNVQLDGDYEVSASPKVKVRIKKKADSGSGGNTDSGTNTDDGDNNSTDTGTDDNSQNGENSGDGSESTQ